METYARILLFMMPVIMTLIILEKFYGWFFKGVRANFLDTVSSMSSGISMVTKNVLGLSITILSYQWLVEHVALIQIKSTWVTYIIAFVALDFSHYWIHRIQHANNFFWNSHSIHHSSEEFDLACAVRQPLSSFFKLFTIFMLPAALLGVSPQVIATVTPIQFFAQFWYHTRHIGRMGFLEYLIVTPSHHRVHHAINKEYLDKNLSQIFIIWDKLFGTFQAELKDVPPVYGITRPMRTWNPIRINFMHLWLLVQDTWRTASWKDKLRVWTSPTGWRPADVKEKFPVYTISDVYHFEKYTQNRPAAFIAWVWTQIIVIFLTTSYLLGNFSSIGAPDIFYYGGFIFISIYALTDFMDGNRSFVMWEGLRCAVGMFIIFYSGDWFGINSLLPYASKMIAVYLIFSLLVTIRLGSESRQQHAGASPS